MIPHRIAVAGRKGGVGKTTIACGMASILASQGKRVLIADLDPQSNVGFAVGVDPMQPGVAKLIAGKKPEPLQASEHLFVLPGGPELEDNVVQSCDPEELADAINQLDFDVVLFDCPPGGAHLERLAIKAAEVAFVVADAHPLALIGAQRVLRELESNRAHKRRGVQRWAMVESKIDKRRALDKTFDAQLAAAFPTLPRFVVHVDTQLATAAAAQTPVMDFDATCRGVKDLCEAVTWGIDG